MYCPKCSQQQASEEVRFCSRCGFSLVAVRELIAADAALVERGAEAQAGQLSPSQRGVRKGAWMMLASVAVTLFAALLTAVINLPDGFEVLLLLPALSFVIGFARVLYGVFLAEKIAPQGKVAASQTHVAPAMPGQSGTAARGAGLYPPRVAPVGSFTAQRVETAEMAQPPGVTESTTRLLDEEADAHRR